MTPEVTPAASATPKGAALADIIRTTGEHRQPQPIPERRPLLATVLLAISLHAAILVHVLPDATEVSDDVHADAISVEIVVEATAPVTMVSETTAGATSRTAEAVAESGPSGSSPAPTPRTRPRSRRTLSAAAHPRPLRTEEQQAEARNAPQAEPSAPVEAAPGSGTASPIASGPDAAPPNGNSPAEPADGGHRDEHDRASSPDTAAAPSAAGLQTAAAAPHGGGGAASEPGASRAQLLEAYGRLLWKRIAARKPQGLRLTGQTGVSFTVAGDGSLLSVRIVRPSGNADLDRLALFAVQAAAPHPPPPTALGTQPLTFEIAFAFH